MAIHTKDAVKGQKQESPFPFWGWLLFQCRLLWEVFFGRAVEVRPRSPEDDDLPF